MNTETQKIIEGPGGSGSSFIFRISQAPVDSGLEQDRSEAGAQKRGRGAEPGPGAGRSAGLANQESQPGLARRDLWASASVCLLWEQEWGWGGAAMGFKNRKEVKMG